MGASLLALAKSIYYIIYDLSCCSFVPVVKSYVLATNFYSHYCGLVFWVEIKDDQNRS